MHVPYLPTSQPWPPPGFRYPYILPNPASVESEDVDMEIEEVLVRQQEDHEIGSGLGVFDEEMVWEPTHQEQIRYLALDTNILIHHLELVKRLHEILQIHRPPLLLLIPSAVINELDKLGKPMRNSKSTLGETDNTGTSSLTSLEEKPVAVDARDATSWLLSMNQRRKATGWGVMRCQRWVERLEKDLHKGDDKILDCCLYFMSVQGGSAKSVTLWTDDRNLSLLAETNDIPTVGGRAITLERVLRISAPDLPGNLSQVDLGQPPSSADVLLPGHASDEPMEDMELDFDVGPDASLQEIAPYISAQSSQPTTPPLQFDTTTKFPVPAVQQASRQTDSDHILKTLANLLHPVLHRLTTETENDTSASQDLAILENLRRILTNLEYESQVSTTNSASTSSTLTSTSSTPINTDNIPPSTTRINLLKGISSLSTIIAYFRIPAGSPSPTKLGTPIGSGSGGQRRPRRGEVVESLEILVLSLDGLGLLEGILGVCRLLP